MTRNLNLPASRHASCDKFCRRCFTVGQAPCVDACRKITNMEANSRYDAQVETDRACQELAAYAWLASDQMPDNTE